MLLSTQRPGEYFGEMIRDRGPRSASVITIELSKFSVITTDRFKKFLSEHAHAGPEPVMSLIPRVRELAKTADRGGYVRMDGERIIIAKSPPRAW